MRCQQLRHGTNHARRGWAGACRLSLEIVSVNNSSIERSNNTPVRKTREARCFEFATHRIANLSKSSTLTALSIHEKQFSRTPPSWRLLSWHGSNSCPLLLCSRAAFLLYPGQTAPWGNRLPLGGCMHCTLAYSDIPSIAQRLLSPEPFEESTKICRNGFGAWEKRCQAGMGQSSCHDCSQHDVCSPPFSVQPPKEIAPTH